MPDPAHFTILEAVKATIQSLALEEIGTGRVHNKLLPTDRGITPPAVVVSLWDKEGLEGGNFEDDWTTYPVLVTFLMVKNQDLTLRKPELAWREKVVAAFRPGRLSGVPSVWRCQIEPQPIIDMRLFLDSQLFAGAVLLRFWVTTTKGKAG